MRARSMLVIPLLVFSILVSLPGVAHENMEINEQGIFNIAPVAVPDKFLTPEEIKRLNAFKDVVEIVGQENTIECILDALMYGKEALKSTDREYRSVKEREIRERGKILGLTKHEISAEIEVFNLGQNEYGKLLFGLGDKRENLLKGGAFIDILLLQQRFFGDKLVLVNTEGYLELELSGPEPSKDAEALIDGFNRIVKASIVPYESNIVTTLYFDNNSRLRDLVYFYYEKPYDFYDVFSQNDAETLQRMKDNDELPFYARQFQEALPSTNPEICRRIVWDENGKIIERFGSSGYETLMKSYNPEKYFSAIHQPKSHAKSALFRMIDPRQIESGLSLDEKNLLDASYSTIRALSNLDSIYNLSTALEKNSEYLFNGYAGNNEDGNSNEEQLSLALRYDGYSSNNVMLTLFDGEQTFRYYVKIANEQSEGSNQEVKYELGGFSIQLNKPSLFYTFVFRQKDGTCTVSKYHRADDQTQYATPCYPHSTCERVPEIVRFVQPFFAGGKFALMHEIKLSHDNTILSEVTSEPCKYVNIKDSESERLDQVFLILN